MWMFFTKDLKCFLGILGNKNRRLVHVDDEMPVAIAAADDEAHELHEVKSQKPCSQLWPVGAAEWACPLDRRTNG